MKKEKKKTVFFTPKAVHNMIFLLFLKVFEVSYAHQGGIHLKG